MLGALLFVIHPDVAWLAFGLGSLAAAAADTWATEIGTWFGGIPRSILTFAPVAAGRSGGVTPLGTLAAAAGACFVALVARLLGVTPTVGIAIAAGGFAGALLDSLLGAVAQAQRWCSACTLVTERVVHDCGTVTTPHRGLSWLDNDAVNLASTLLGGLLAAWMAR
jgi:uncharacterized protein (TIGR00297 family)